MGRTNPNAPDLAARVGAASARRLPAARRIAGAWRRLGGGAPTLVACSGGADSTALLLVLAGVTRALTVAHVVHDLRPAPEAEADRDAVEALAADLGLGFVQARVTTPAGSGGREADARRARYRALATLAGDAGRPVVVTGHHADDQLETLLMRLARGAGPRGLRGVLERRPLGPGVTLVRPMLGVTRADARSLCDALGVAWREDGTNADPSTLRNALRAGAAADLASLVPAAPLAASRLARRMAEVERLVDDLARASFGDADRWARADLRGLPEPVLFAGLRRAVLGGGARGADRLTDRALGPAVRSIRSASGETRVFTLAGGVRVTVARDEVRVGRASD